MSLERAELLDATDQEGCVLCGVVQRATRRYLWHVLHEYALDGGLHLRLRRSLGFCRRHAWALQRLEAEAWQDDLGTATLYEGLTRAVTHALRVLTSEPETVPPRRRWIRALETKSASAAILRPSGECPACVNAREKEMYMTKVLLQSIEDDESLRLRYRASVGLCLPHLVAAVGVCQDEATRRFLIEVQAEKLERLGEELEDYGRKHAVDHQDEPKGQEQTSWVRVIEQFVGKPESP
jgi:hypothetical protein